MQKMPSQRKKKKQLFGEVEGAPADSAPVGPVADQPILGEPVPAESAASSEPAPAPAPATGEATPASEATPAIEATAAGEVTSAGEATPAGGATPAVEATPAGEATTVYCRASKSKPAWTHARCWGCIDLPTDLMLMIECDTLEIPGGSPAPAPAPMAREPSITGDEAIAHDQTVLLKTVGLGGASRPILNDELVNVCSMLREALALRRKYRSDVEREMFHDPTEVEEASEEPYDPFTPPQCAGRHFSFQIRRGVAVVWEEASAAKAGLKGYGSKDERPPAFPAPPSLSAYTEDLARLLHISSDAAVNSFCYGRLQKLEARFRLHTMEHSLASLLASFLPYLPTYLPTY